MVRAPVLALLAVALLMAGCISPAPQAQEQPTGGPAAGPSGSGNATVIPPKGNATSANGTFPPQEHDLHVVIYANVADGMVDTGNMADASWTVEVPAAARWVKATATWTPSTPLSANLNLMIHNGTAEQPGKMLVGKAGGSPIALDPIPIPEGQKTLDIMCHVDGNPVGAEVLQDVHLKVEFA
jgi:hypothetical protein